MIEYAEFFFNCNEPFVSDLESLIEDVRENYVMAWGFAPGLGRIEPTVMGRQEAEGWYIEAGQRSVGTSWEGQPFHWNELSKSQVKAEALDRRRKMIAERDAFRADMARLKAAFAAAAGFLGGDVEIASGDIVGEDVRVRLKNGAALLVGNGGCRYGETYRLRGQTETHLWRERLEPTADGSAHEIMDASGETLSRHAVEGDAAAGVPGGERFQPDAPPQRHQPNEDGQADRRDDDASQRPLRCKVTAEASGADGRGGRAAVPDRRRRGQLGIKAAPPNSAGRSLTGPRPKTRKSQPLPLG